MNGVKAYIVRLIDMSDSRKPLPVSVVIPCYNEAAHIEACLESIAAQTCRPLEVLVVDNNSTDGSADIARSYDFVTLITEKHQGIVYARNAGFNHARGEIIARTDADSVASPDWISELHGYLAKHPKVCAISGKYRVTDLLFPRLSGLLQVLLYQHLQRLLAGTNFLCGANVAIRRRSWLEVRASTSSRTDIDEDIDLTFCLKKRGLKVAYNPKMIIKTPFAAERVSLKSVAAYLSTWPRNYMLHGMPARSAIIRCLNVVILASVAPLAAVSGLRRDLSE
jgi:glycosyltransferase involved in cell wall biosynthesis